MRRRNASPLRGLGAATLWLAAATASATAAVTPVGNWLTEDGHGVIGIAVCGDSYCGRIVGIDRDPGTPMPTDVKGRPQCGLTILTNEKPTGDGDWLGQITDPRDGKTYGAKLWLDDRGNLRVRGFLGIPLLGSTQVWHPFMGRIGPECQLISTEPDTPRPAHR